MSTSASVRLSVAMALAGLLGLGRLPAAPGDGLSNVAVDRLFAKWPATTPGCAVAASVNGVQTLARAYGLADLEHDTPNTPDTIFEAGSVSKQFTAAAVLLLARDGKLALDDPVRKYIPELPDYSAQNGGAPLTIRHLLTHTSGLRDWGSVEDIAGWPRTTRVYTQAHVLDILSRQRALNFPSGTRWSYCNSGYNLAAMIVTRVSGTSFAELTRQRLFVPLGMTHTSWRDDHTRIVKNRAMAYAEERDGFHTLMPFEDVYGNSSLLTTVGDLLRWNQHFEATSPAVGDVAFAREEEQPGRFADGRAHTYALGLRIGTYKGLQEIGHDGATAGYRAELVRYPAQHVSIAVLCNVDSGATVQYAHQVADLLLGDRLLKASPPPTPGYTLTAADIDAIRGLYAGTIAGAPLRIIPDDKGGLRFELGGGRQALIAKSATSFVTASGDTLTIDPHRGARLTDRVGTVEEFRAVPAVSAASLTAEQLQPLLGVYTSDEAEATLSVALGPDGKSLVIDRRPASTFTLTPIYPDAFAAPGLGLITFRRDPANSGRITALSVTQDRVWDLRFTRSAGPASDRSGRRGGPE